MKACANCGSEVISRVEDFPYRVSDFRVMLGGITVLRCTKCDACAPVIPNVIGLHRTIVRMVANKSGALSDGERRFLLEFLQNENANINRIALHFLRHWPLRGARVAEYLLRAVALSHLDDGEHERVALHGMVQLSAFSSDSGTRWSRRPRPSSELAHPN